ncbi:hypothetical protein ES703_113045 [subsurface metagenome]
MAKKKQKRKDSRYIPPEMVPFNLYSACLGVVISENKQAKEIYDGIVECGYLPGYQMLQEEAGNLLPDSGTILKDIIEKSGYDVNKPPSKDTQGISYVRGMIRGGLEVISEYTDRIFPEIQKKNLIMRDLNILNAQIDQLVKIGFNREEDQRTGNYKVISTDDNKLGEAILLIAQCQFNKNMLSTWEKIRIIEYAGKRYNMSEIMNDEATLRLYRQVVNQYKKSGFLLKHDATLEFYPCNHFAFFPILFTPQVFKPLLATNTNLFCFIVNPAGKVVFAKFVSTCFVTV